MYAYDYSESETPLVGQGMLSWVLASSSPTPDVPAAESKTMVTGRVCKNPMGIFSKGAGAQETLEVKLRLVPVPTVMQSQYVDNMQKYREMGNSTPQDMDSQSWANFIRLNPTLADGSRSQLQTRSTVGSPMSGCGIERFHQILSEGATPRELPAYERNEPVRSVSPTHSYGGNSRVSTPGGFNNVSQHTQSQSRQPFQSSDMIRPSSSASMRENDHQMQPSLKRRDSTQSGYASGGEDNMDPPRKRAKLYQAAWPGKSDMNIEKQPSSLRVAASTAASVRIHRPTPVNPSIAAEQSHVEPVRPPTPIMRPGGPRRALPQSSMLRESSVVSSYTSPYFNSDDIVRDNQSHSPEESRYQGLFEPPFTMPSSPPVMNTRFPSQSSPVLPSLTLDTDSGFMSGGIEDSFEDEGITPIECRQRAGSQGPAGIERPCSVRPAVQATSPMSVSGQPDTPKDPTPKPLPPQQSRPQSSAGSRPSSRSGIRLAPKPQPSQIPPPIVPFPPVEVTEKAIQNVPAVPASDPVAPTYTPLQHAQTPTAPMSDMDEAIRCDSSTKGGLKRKNRARQIKERLDDAIKKGQVPPFCNNCGCIETPTWRRTWSKVVEGNEDLAKEMMQEKGALFYEVTERDPQNAITKFKAYQKTPAQREKENGWDLITLCNPCGLWLYKFRFMRPENKWNKSNPERAPRKKLPARNRTTGGPLSTRTRSKAPINMAAASSPAPTEASSVQLDESVSPQVEEFSEDDADQEPPSKRQRSGSAEPPASSESSKAHWESRDPAAALQRAIELSPARNMTNNKPSPSDAPSLTPRPLRRALFSTSSNSNSPLKELNPTMVNTNSPRRSPRFVRNEKDDAEKENQDPTPRDDLDDLFESPSNESGIVSPTPRRCLSERLAAYFDPEPPVHTGIESLDRLANSPTRLAAQRLQRLQEQNERADEFAALDSMLFDLFSAPSKDHPGVDDGSPQDQDWTEWVPEGYVSPPPGLTSGPSDELVQSILSNPSYMKESFQNFDFESLAFPDVNVPDSGFFSSDPFSTDSSIPPKPQSPEQAEGQQQVPPTA